LHRPAGGAGSRENLLRTMPWYPCNSINTAIREISPSAADRHSASHSDHRTALFICWRNIFCHLIVAAALSAFSQSSEMSVI
jgi:hypothetical protein